MRVYFLLQRSTDMPKINGAGEPTFADARGTDAMATNARDESYYLDPTITTDDDGKIVDTKDLTIEGDEAEAYETREEREQRETREREEAARDKTRETLDEAKAHEHESGDYDADKRPTPADTAKQAAFEKNKVDDGTKTDDKAVASSPGTSSKASSTRTGKTSGSN